MSISINYNDRSFGSFESRVDKAFSGEPVDAEFTLGVIQMFSQYDLGPHMEQKTTEFAAFLQEKIDSGQIEMDNRFGAADTLIYVLSVMEKGDIPKNHLRNEMHRIFIAVHNQPDSDYSPNPES